MMSLTSLSAYFNFKYLKTLFENSLSSGNVETIQVIVAHLSRVNVAVATIEELETLQLIILISLLEWVLSMKDVTVDRLQVDCMNIFEICLQVIAKMPNKSVEMNGLQGIREQLVLIRRAWRWRKNSVSVWRCYVKRLRSCLLALEVDFRSNLELGKNDAESKEKASQSQTSNSKNVPATRLRSFMSNAVMADFEEVVKMISNAYTNRYEDLNNQVATLQGMIPKCDILPYGSSPAFYTSPINRKEARMKRTCCGCKRQIRPTSVQPENAAVDLDSTEDSGNLQVGAVETSLVSSTGKRESSAEVSENARGETSVVDERKQSLTETSVTGSGKLQRAGNKSVRRSSKGGGGSEKEFITSESSETVGEKSEESKKKSSVADKVFESRKQPSESNDKSSRERNKGEFDGKHCQDPEVSSGIQVQSTSRVALERVRVKKKQQSPKKSRIGSENETHVSDTSNERQMVEESSVCSKTGSPAKEIIKMGETANLPSDSPTQSERFRCVQKFIDDQPITSNTPLERQRQRQLYNADEYLENAESHEAVELRRSKLPGRAPPSKHTKYKRKLTFSSDSDTSVDGLNKRKLRRKSSRDSLSSLPLTCDSKRRVSWTSEETKRLVLGIYHKGTQWAAIKKSYFSTSSRTNVNLKDRYRTLMAQGILRQLLAEVEKEQRGK